MRPRFKMKVLFSFNEIYFGAEIYVCSINASRLIPGSFKGSKNSTVLEFIWGRSLLHRNWWALQKWSRNKSLWRHRGVQLSIRFSFFNTSHARLTLWLYTFYLPNFTCSAHFWLTIHLSYCHSCRWRGGHDSSGLLVKHYIPTLSDP